MGRKILIYAEGGFTTGLGNVYRSLSLAQSVKQTCSVQIEFITSSEEYVRDIIINKGFNVHYLEDKNKIVTFIENYRPDLLIIDYLGISYEFVKCVKTTGSKIAIIGNNTKSNNLADLVVNAIIGTDFVNEIKIDSFGTKYLLGPKYLVLRDEFYDIEKQYVYRNNLKNILLLFGGTDQANFTCATLDALTNNKENGFFFNIVLGAGYRFKDELEKLIKKKSLQNRISIRENISDVSQTLLSADFFLTSAGTALFEAFKLRIPTLALFQNQSQKEVFRSFYRTTDFNNINNLEYSIINYYNDNDTYNEQLDLLSVGTGKDGIVKEIISFL